MTNAIFLTTTEPYSGKSIISIGLVNLLASKAEKIAYFKPVISRERNEKDGHLEMLVHHFKLNIPYEDMFVFTLSEVVKYINAGKEAYVIDTIIDRFKKLQERYDFVVVEGSDFLSRNANIEFDGNISIAKNLGIPVAVIVKGDDKSVPDMIDSALSTTKSFSDEGVQILTVIANKVDVEKEEEIKSKLNKALPAGMIVTAIPSKADLGNPTMKEICESVKGKVLLGDHLLSNQVSNSIVGAMQLHNCLTRLSKNTLIVTPGDRGDIIIGALQANISKNYSKL